VIARIIVFSAVFSLVLGVAAWADVGGDDEEFVVPPPAPAPAPMIEEVVVEEVAAAPPAFVELERTSLGAGVGVSWGDGTLYFDGDRHAFSILGAGLGDFGAARITAEGPVEHLENVDDFEGSYLAVEADATAGAGAGMLTMRNQNGVVIHVRAESAGLRVALATEGFRIDLE
jgi:outer membrane immunogenic protein